ncbi:hypothetical protein MRV_0124 [Murine roseolovirus]|uniref:Uncharacterized protein n=1 Tax=Murid betaherpesvirus 3 TaxID=2560603 RepID=A0A1P8VJ16_9BETA|nr:hypothetical protein MRV_0124 [Murine roseolovirus]APZ76335.1 hypothetical protein MRV_0124 [Murid betaherpesvirus 3]
MGAEPSPHLGGHDRPDGRGRNRGAGRGRGRGRGRRSAPSEVPAEGGGRAALGRGVEAHPAQPPPGVGELFGALRGAVAAAQRGRGNRSPRGRGRAADPRPHHLGPPDVAPGPSGASYAAAAQVRPGDTGVGARGRGARAHDQVRGAPAPRARQGVAPRFLRGLLVPQPEPAPPVLPGAQHTRADQDRVPSGHFHPPTAGGVRPTHPGDCGVTVPPAGVRVPGLGAEPSSVGRVELCDEPGAPALVEDGGRPRGSDGVGPEPVQRDVWRRTGHLPTQVRVRGRGAQPQPLALPHVGEGLGPRPAREAVDAGGAGHPGARHAAPGRKRHDGMDPADGDGRPDWRVGGDGPPGAPGQPSPRILARGAVPPVAASPVVPPVCHPSGGDWPPLPSRKQVSDAAAAGHAGGNRAPGLLHIAIPPGATLITPPRSLWNERPPARSPVPLKRHAPPEEEVFELAPDSLRPDPSTQETEDAGPGTVPGDGAGIPGNAPSSLRLPKSPALDHSPGAPPPDTNKTGDLGGASDGQSLGGGEEAASAEAGRAAAGIEDGAGDEDVPRDGGEDGDSIPTGSGPSTPTPFGAVSFESALSCLPADDSSSGESGGTRGSGDIFARMPSPFRRGPLPSVTAAHLRTTGLRLARAALGVADAHPPDDLGDGLLPLPRDALGDGLLPIPPAYIHFRQQLEHQLRGLAAIRLATAARPGFAAPGTPRGGFLPPGFCLPVGRLPAPAATPPGFRFPLHQHGGGAPFAAASPSAAAPTADPRDQEAPVPQPGPGTADQKTAHQTLTQAPAQRPEGIDVFPTPGLWCNPSSETQPSRGRGRGRGAYGGRGRGRGGDHVGRPAPQSQQSLGGFQRSSPAPPRFQRQRSTPEPEPAQKSSEPHRYQQTRRSKSCHSDGAQTPESKTGSAFKRPLKPARGFQFPFRQHH